MPALIPNWPKMIEQFVRWKNIYFRACCRPIYNLHPVGLMVVPEDAPLKHAKQNLY